MYPERDEATLWLWTLENKSFIYLVARDMRLRIRSVNNMNQFFIPFHKPSCHFMIGRLSDLWMYNLSLNTWIWLNGDSTVGNLGIYGTKGVATLGNQPGGRSHHEMALDKANQLIYIFGGTGLAETSTEGLYFYLRFSSLIHCW